ncbi:hypothetical protein [Streptomyces lonarensis]|uniref:Integral membrane protein n=1 Tax=Streptomyces lonarensis TaxID=700599 RepID=A0A7X6I155_9ACTN|nr:hypothetical protein [Streptomyces lonarensis]NJQ08205.1 hypothetical protein [Streptomyces lonarensis]
MPAALDVRLMRAALFAAACCVLASTGHVLAAGSGIEPWKLGAGWLALFLAILPLAGRERRSLPGIVAVVAGSQLLLHVLFGLGHGAAAGGADAAAGHAGHTGGAGGGDAAGGGGVLSMAAKLLCNDELLKLTPAEADRIVTEAGLRPPPMPDGSTADVLPQAAGGLAAVPGEVAAALVAMTAPAMLAGHLLAALAAGWLLLRGEAALWRLIRLSGAAVAALPGALRVAVAAALLLCGRAPAAPAAPVRPRGTGHHPPPATSGRVLSDAVARRGPPAADRDRSTDRLTLAA